MKKICINLVMVLIFFLLSGCSFNDEKDTVKNGTYVMEHEETEEGLLPHVAISDDEILFSYDALSSYLPHGTYSIKDDMLTMTADDNKYIYVFQIDGDNLIFQKNESSSVNLIDDRIGPKVKDKAKFHLDNLSNK